MTYEDKYLEFEQYIRATESEPKEKAELWQTANGLHDVDGFMVPLCRLGIPLEYKQCLYLSYRNV